MKVLLAINDRDLLSGLDRLLAIKGINTDTAFDGVQAISLLSREKYDLAVIDEYITLFNAKRITEACKNEFGTNTLVLKSKNSTGYSADEEIIYPFLPEEFYTKLHSALKTKGDEVS